MSTPSFPTTLCKPRLLQSDGAVAVVTEAADDVVAAFTEAATVKTDAADTAVAVFTEAVDGATDAGDTSSTQI